MTEPRYPAEWECDVILADGGTAHLRPLRRDDADLLVAFLTRLSDRSRLLRFFAPVSPQIAYRAARFDEVDYESTFGIVALLGDDLIAVGTWQRADDPAVAEVAFAVADEHQARGIGSMLLEHLAATGRAAGLQRFSASTLAENRRMLRVFHEAGWDVEKEHAEGVVELSFPIDDDERTRAVLYRREHLAEARSMDRVLHPTSIAVVGAGRDPGGPGRRVLEHLRVGGFTGALYAVNPAASAPGAFKPGALEPDAFGAVPCVARVTDIAGPVDLAVVSVPETALGAVVDDCAAKGVHALVVLTATTGDADAREALTHRLVVDSRRHGMRVLGPECLGVVNTDPDVSMQATVVPVHPTRGRIGWCSQSGAIGLDLLARATDAGLGVSTFVSLGDKADVSGNDLLQYWDADPATDLVLLYLESFGNPRKFARVARRVAVRKPIVAVKSARSAAGYRGAAVRATLRDDSDLAVGALLGQSGVVRVDTLEELLVTAAVFESGALPLGDRVGIVGNAIGPTVVAADACVAAGLTVTDSAGGANPRHLPTAVHPDAFAAALEEMLADDGIDAVLAIVVPLPWHDADATALRDVVGAVAGTVEKPVVACVLGQRDLVGHAGRVPTLAFAEHAAGALARAAAYVQWRDRPPGTLPDLDPDALADARCAVARVLDGSPDGAALTGDDLATVLTAAGAAVAAGGSDTDSGGVWVRVVRDDAFGPLISFGIGADPVATAAAGTSDDEAVGIAPMTDVDARTLICAPRGARAFVDDPDHPARAIDALAALVARVARVADAIPELAEFGLGPVIVTAEGVQVVRAEAWTAPVAGRAPVAVRRMRDG
jgi:acyl-CoA synthetase (NDP forming)/GNAT superfamily N-acetyltransferase